jgi:CRP-like cAMP-binding protein
LKDAKGVPCTGDDEMDMKSAESTECLNRLRIALKVLSGMTDEDFDLSIPHWQLKTYVKGEPFNEYNHSCKYLGFVLEGIFRVYRLHDRSGAEKTMFFFTKDQFMCSFKDFFGQNRCEYFMQSLRASRILCIHYDTLQHLYRTSPGWNCFGRMFAESALYALVTNTEAMIFKSPEERYLELSAVHPDVFNTVPLYHIASYLGIEAPSLSRIRKRIAAKAVER